MVDDTFIIYGIDRNMQGRLTIYTIELLETFFFLILYCARNYKTFLCH